MTTTFLILHMSSLSKISLFLQAKNKDNAGTIILKFECLLEMAGYQGTILESTIQTYFDYGSSRIEMISQLIDIDINSKKLRIQKENQLENVANLEKSLEELGTNEYVIEQRLLFKSNLIQVFRNTEADALENIFHLAAALK